MPAAPPPAWMVLGFEAALADPAPNMVAAALRLLRASELAGAVPPGDRAGAVIDRLLPLLDGDSDWFVRQAAAEALGRIAPGDRTGAVIDRLLPLLGDSDEGLRRATAEVLGRIAPADRVGAVVSSAVIDRLLRLLGDDSHAVRAAAAAAFGQIVKGERASAVIDRLLLLLGDGFVVVRSAAAQALGRIAPGDRAGAVIDGLLPLLGDSDWFVRQAAAEALGRIAPGDRASSVVDGLLPLFGDSEWSVRRAAAEALGRIAPADRAGAVIDGLLPLLADSNAGIRLVAATALGGIAPGERAGAVIDSLLPFLRNDGVNRVREFDNRFGGVRAAATEALGRIAKAGDAYGVINRLLPLLDDPNTDVREATAEALGRIATADRVGAAVSSAVIDRLLPFLDDHDAVSGRIVIRRRSGVSQAAVEALGRIATDDRRGAVTDRLLPLLGYSGLGVRQSAATALGRVAAADRTDAVIDRLLPLLDEDPGNSRDRRVIRAAAEALGRITTADRAGAVIDRLLPLLDGDHREAATTALGRIAANYRVNAVIFSVVIDRLLTQLGDYDHSVRRAAEEALAHIGPGGVSSAILAARLVHLRAAGETPATRVAAHVATGAGAKGDGAEIILAWLGRATPPVDRIAARPEAAHAVLALLLRHWDALAPPPTPREETAVRSLRQEAEARVMDIAYAACRGAAQAESAGQLLQVAQRWLRLLPLQGPIQRCWQQDQLTTLKALQGKLQQAGSTHAPALGALVRAEEAAPVWQWATWGLLGWAAFWAAFLFAFPWSRHVQAAFFWNPALRRMLSLWFVPLLLFLLPPLRRRLLAPFRDALLAPARLEDLPRLGFFGQGRAQPERGPPAPIQELLRDLRGTAVLRGDAGLGKSSALRWYAAQARRPVAFLGARDCAEGVDVAIARRIHDVQEKGFVRMLVHSGALIVIVDGLNEVSAATRERISAFAAEMEKGQVLIGTQPIEWTPPATARTLDLLPLDRPEAEAFLLSRPAGADAGSRVHGEAYAMAVRAFLRRNLDEAPTEEERAAAAIVLSNPFDLTLASDLLAQGLKPSATALIGEAFRMADQGTPGEPGYRAIAGQPFPLVRFGQLAVAMRLEDRNWFKPEEFPAELTCLIARRLLVRRSVNGPAGIEERVLFRHDRVWDFFIAAAFEEDPALWEQHLADPRFRGAYLRIAETWPPEAAAKVRELVIVRAAETGDHTTSDAFIKRLAARGKPASRTRAKGASARAAPATTAE